MTRYVIQSQRAGPPTLHLEADLNEQQQAVVLAAPGQILVIAGAGCGKTRTLTYRAAYLLAKGLCPDRILLCTFTNRAAKEMVTRVEQLLGCAVKPRWAGTFHHIANLALRRYADTVGLSPNYSILDREDAQNLLAACLAEEGHLLRTRRFPKPAVLINLFSRLIDSQSSLSEAIRIFLPRFVDLTDSIGRIFHHFEERKRKSGLVDYDDLIFYFKRLLTEHPQPAAELGAQFEHVLVDEYQDTSCLQGEIIDLCSAYHGNLTAVGDDAQSIYSFRGANFRNIIEFQQRYPEAKIFKLEINYRSSPQILHLANASIACNLQQYPKILRPVRPSAMMPALIPLRDVYQQADFVAQRVLELHQEEGIPLRQIAVLYRAHAHCLELQVELTRRDIPFSIRSGLKFFEQAHIKDIIAYLRLSHNPTDLLAWHRVLKLWPGVGPKSVARVIEAVQHEQAGACSCTLLASAKIQQDLPLAARSSIGRLAQLMENLQRQKSVNQMVDIVINDHYANYAHATFANAETRLEDLKQFATYAMQYQGLEHLLSDLALVAGMAAEAVGTGEMPDEKITLSTVHQAKGLEWSVVFILWLAEGYFPQAMSLRSPEEAEEERRLFHVAVTRAIGQIYLCHPQFEESNQGPRRLLRISRFISELSTRNPPYERWCIEEASA